jgi:sugar lactone lactonase YvrE
MFTFPALLLVYSTAGRSQTKFTISTVAGNGAAAYSGDGGSAINAGLNDPNGAAVDAAGNLYIAEYLGERVRKVATNGTITTVAGTGVPGFSSDGGPATMASLNGPFRVALDRAGNLYVSDNGNHRVRKVTSDGTIITVAGNGSANSSGDGGPATDAAIGAPGDLALDVAGNLFIASPAFAGDFSANVIRKVTPGGLITTVAGNGIAGYSGDGGLATGVLL